MSSPHDALLGCGGGFDRRGLIFEKVFGQAGLSPTVFSLLPRPTAPRVRWAAGPPSNGFPNQSHFYRSALAEVITSARLSKALIHGDRTNDIESSSVELK